MVAARSREESMRIARQSFADCLEVHRERHAMTELERGLQEHLEAAIQVWMNTTTPPIHQFPGHIIVRAKYQVQWLRPVSTDAPLNNNNTNNNNNMKTV